MLSKLLKLKNQPVSLKGGRAECSCSECQPVNHSVQPAMSRKPLYDFTKRLVGGKNKLWVSPSSSGSFSLTLIRN